MELGVCMLLVFGDVGVMNKGLLFGTLRLQDLGFVWVVSENLSRGVGEFVEEKALETPTLCSLS